MNLGLKRKTKSHKKFTHRFPDWFSQEEKYVELAAALQKENIEWKLLGPANKRYLSFMLISDLKARRFKISLILLRIHFSPIVLSSSSV